MTEEEKRGFTMGLIYGLGLLAVDFLDPGTAAMIWEESRIDNEEARYCTEYDVSKLREAVPDLPKGEE